jgi:hypothetical protein
MVLPCGFFFLLSDLGAVLIASSEIHAMFSAFFEGLWMASQEYGKRKDR